MEKGRTEGKEIKLRPVGTAYLTEKEDIMKIIVYPQYAEGLEGIEALDFIYVLYWMDRLSEKDRTILRVHPRGDKSKPLRGVFSLRSPMRPNPIGLARVKLIKREGNIVLVKGLDALDGSPVIDIMSG